MRMCVSDKKEREIDVTELSDRFMLTLCPPIRLKLWKGKKQRFLICYFVFKHFAFSNVSEKKKFLETFEENYAKSCMKLEY